MKLISITLIALLCTAGQANAQTDANPVAATPAVTTPQTDSAADKGKQTLDAIRAGIGMAPLSRAFSPFSGFEFTSNQDSSTASFKFAKTYSASSGDLSIFDTYSATISQSVQKGADSTDIWSSKGNNTTQVELKWSHLTTTARRRPNLLDPDILAICARAIAISGDKNRKPEDGCDAGFVAQFSRADTTAFLAKYWAPDKSTTIKGGRVKFGRQKLTYYDGTTLQKATPYKTPWSAGVFWNYLPKGAGSLYGLSLDVGEAYKDQDAKTLCPTGSGIVTCVTGPIGAPKLKKTQTVAFEIRHTYDHFAIAPQLSYDAGTEETAFDLPIYLVSDGKDGLTGGIRLSWTSKDNEATAGFFVTKAFNLFDN